ncbi:CoA ester lyase [Polymorphobacter arshaanensis]|uniref:CoA ester lyase n=1 Tax=Glacieibacterium arshaanense TaxID=2511025 RepID=A0A4Y9ERG0_9SPHN|nr:CoA ester lyase [Polymorphobacter arshaanensis]TFU05488.1 CoA ester lyase [Polymorphobacter arshaanensis]
MASDSAVARPRRSALYLPASNVRAIEKARDLDCDVVILDLEDAVAPDAKVSARANAVQAVRDGGFGRRELVVRVNGLDTAWGHDDLAACGAIGADAVLAPKVGSAADVRAYDGQLAGNTALWAMIETCEAVLGVAAIAAAAAQSRLAAFVAGTNDLAKQMRARQTPDRQIFVPALFNMVAAARANGLAALDGVYNALEDDAGLEAQCRQGADFGFDGKTLIHPRQVPIANAAFGPSADEVVWARKVVAAFADPSTASSGVIRLEGQMVERLHLAEARQLLAIWSAIGGTDG